MGKTCGRGLFCDLEEGGPYHRGNLEPACPRGVDESPSDLYESSVEIILVIILRAVCYSTVYVKFAPIEALSYTTRCSFVGGLEDTEN
jgi:hypothetical protein